MRETLKRWIITWSSFAFFTSYALAATPRTEVSIRGDERFFCRFIVSLPKLNPETGQITPAYDGTGFVIGEGHSFEELKNQLRELMISEEAPAHLKGVRLDATGVPELSRSRFHKELQKTLREMDIPRKNVVTNVHTVTRSLQKYTQIPVPQAGEASEGFLKASSILVKETIKYLKTHHPAEWVPDVYTTTLEEVSFFLPRFTGSDYQRPEPGEVTSQSLSLVPVEGTLGVLLAGDLTKLGYQALPIAALLGVHASMLSGTSAVWRQTFANWCIKDPRGGPVRVKQFITSMLYAADFNVTPDLVTKLLILTAVPHADFNLLAAALVTIIQMEFYSRIVHGRLNKFVNDQRTAEMQSVAKRFLPWASFVPLVVDAALFYYAARGYAPLNLQPIDQLLHQWLPFLPNAFEVNGYVNWWQFALGAWIVLWDKVIFEHTNYLPKGLEIYAKHMDPWLLRNGNLVKEFWKTEVATPVKKTLRTIKRKIWIKNFNASNP